MGELWLVRNDNHPHLDTSVVAKNQLTLSNG